MSHRIASRSGQLARSAALTAAGVVGTAATWRLRPPAPSSSASPESAIVLGCGWLAWALIGYLLIATTAASGSRLGCGLGLRIGLDRLALISPARLRRAVDRAVTVGVVATVVGIAVPAGVATAQPSTGGPRQAQEVGVGVLDWPGLTTPGLPVTAAHRPPRPHRPTRAPEAHRPRTGSVHPTPPVPPSTGPRVIVRPGDSLWSIAAEHLGPDPATSAVAAMCDRWYAANRAVVGDDPDLIYPGERLHEPSRSQSAAPAGGGR